MRLPALNLMLFVLCACQPPDAAAPPAEPAVKPASVLISNVTIIDGSGASGYAGSVRVSGGLVEAVGDLVPLPGETVLDGGGQVLAPGFIDISADIYPYEYWQSFMYVLLPDRDVSKRAEVEFALSELAPPEGIWFSRFDAQPEYVGKSLTEIALLRGIDAVTAFQQLFNESMAVSGPSGEPADMIIAYSMTETDIVAPLTWPQTNICTDGALSDLHPRGAGSFTRVLGHYVRELKALSLEQAIHKMSGLSAAHMGIGDRGLIRPGLAADLVLFDPATVVDNATPQDPAALSSGISRVWVNGETVFVNGAASGRRPGIVVRRGRD